MWPNSVITSLLDIDYPIVQAPMILQKPLVPLASAVSNAGGLGSLGCAEMPIFELEQRFDEMLQATDKPFNLNFFLHETPAFDADLDTEARKLVEPFYQKIGLELPTNAVSSSLGVFDDEILDFLILKRPAMVSFHFGCPSVEAVNSLKSVGIITVASATTVIESQMLEAAGIDFVVAQGWEAGGHRGAFESGDDNTGIGTLALVPQIVDAVDIPVFAAGGIGDGRGIAAALALGADGVWMGTAFLSCTETPITSIHRKALLDARDEDTHLSKAFSGRPCRARKTPYSIAMKDNCLALPVFPLMYNYSGPIKKFGIERSDVDYQFLLYGQAATLNQELTVAQLISKLCSETADTLQKLTG